jgi:hypothetical protein
MMSERACCPDAGTAKAKAKAAASPGMNLHRLIHILIFEVNEGNISEPDQSLFTKTLLELERFLDPFPDFERDMKS